MAKKPVKETIHAKGMDIAIILKIFKTNLSHLQISHTIKVVNPKMSLKIG